MNREQWQIKRCQHDALPQNIHAIDGISYPSRVFPITVDSRFGLTPANDAEDAGALIHPITGRDDAGSCCDWSRPDNSK